MASTCLGCTSAIISGSKTLSGRPLLWKHRDTSNANSRVAYIKATKIGEISYVGLFNANDRDNIQTWIGMNESGFAIMNTASYNINPPGSVQADREGIVMTEALKKCRNVQEFAVFLDSLPRPLGVETNFGVIDAMGNGAYFETGDYGYQRYDLKDAPDGLLIRTNYSHSGREGEGSGYMRERNAMAQLLPAARNCSVTPEMLTERLSRSFYRDDFGYDRLNDTIRIIEDIDYIPRYTSVATVVIEGLQTGCDTEKDIVSQYIMWTGLGYPPCAEIRPVWCRQDGVDDDLQGQGTDNHAPLADKAQIQRLDVFSTCQNTGKTRLVDIHKLSNPFGTGYRQMIIPVNLDTYRQYHER